MIYSDIDSKKKAFVFELDNVFYPEKDYLLQVYYLFASFMEYTELLDAKVLLKLMTDTFYAKGHDHVFEEVKTKFELDEKYRFNFHHLLLNAQLPLKLLLYDEMLTLLQDMVVDRKQIFVVTNGNPQLQLNKIKQTEWHGLDEYLICFFAEEFAPKPETHVIDMLLKTHRLNRRDVLITGTSITDQQMAHTSRIDYLDVENFLTLH